MPVLAQKFNFGNALQNDNPDLYRQLDQTYTTTAQIVNTKISKYSTSGVDAPANNQLNANFEIGDIYVRTDTDTAWIMTSRTSNEIVNWQLIT